MELLLDFRTGMSKISVLGRFPSLVQWDTYLRRAGPPFLVSLFSVLGPNNALVSKGREVKVSICEGFSLSIGEHGNQERRAVLWGKSRKKTVGTEVRAGLTLSLILAL